MKIVAITAKLVATTFLVNQLHRSRLFMTTYFTYETQPDISDTILHSYFTMLRMRQTLCRNASREFKISRNWCQSGDNLRQD